MTRPRQIDDRGTSSPDPPEEPQQARSRRTRQRIVDAALARFGTGGYRATNIASIAADAGVTDAGLIYHFPTKEALLFAVLRAAEDAVQARVTEASDGGLAYVRAMRDWGVEMEREEAITALHTILSGEHLLDDSRINAYFRSRYDHAVGLTLRALERAVERGELRPGVDIEREARLAHAVMDGARLQHFYSDGRISMAGLVRTHVDHMLDRITPPA